MTRPSRIAFASLGLSVGCRAWEGRLVTHIVDDSGLSVAARVNPDGRALEIVSNGRTLARRIVPIPNNPPVDGV